MFNPGKTPPTQESTPAPVRPQTPPVSAPSPVQPSGKFFSPLHVTLIIVGVLFLVGAVVIAVTFNGSPRSEKIGNAINQGADLETKRETLLSKKEEVVSQREANRQALRDKATELQQQTQGSGTVNNQVPTVPANGSSLPDPTNTAPASGDMASEHYTQQTTTMTDEDKYNNDTVELKQGWIRTAYSKDGKNFIQIDFTRPCQQDDECTTSEYFVNEGSYVTTLELSAGVKIISYTGGTAMDEITFKQLQEVNLRLRTAPSQVWVNKASNPYLVDKIATAMIGLSDDSEE